MPRKIRLGILIALIAAVALGSRLVLSHYERYPTTDDAYVQANVVRMVARVSGPVVDLPVVDNQQVRAGEYWCILELITTGTDCHVKPG